MLSTTGSKQGSKSTLSLFRRDARSTFLLGPSRFCTASLLNINVPPGARFSGAASFFFLAAVALILCGCANYQSKIKFGNAALVLPKDAAFDGLQISHTVSNGFTNLTVTITNATFRMNPDVIDAKTRHDLELFKAGGETVVKGIGAAK